MYTIQSGSFTMEVENVITPGQYICKRDTPLLYKGKRNLKSGDIITVTGIDQEGKVITNELTFSTHEPLFIEIVSSINPL